MNAEYESTSPSYGQINQTIKATAPGDEEKYQKEELKHQKEEKKVKREERKTVGIREEAMLRRKEEVQTGKRFKKNVKEILKNRDTRRRRNERLMKYGINSRRKCIR